MVTCHQRCSRIGGQLPPQHAGLVARWLIAHWASTGEDVCIADWDESNAYCNIPRQDLPTLFAPLCPTLASWLQRFYSALSVYVVTPHGLTHPCSLLHGGGQGDSGGVGAYMAVGIMRTRFHRGVLLHSLHPRDLSHGAAPASSICFAAPFDLAKQRLPIAPSGMHCFVLTT